ncbi:MAG TPA: MFS transporter [Anaerolineales bacterium]|nr:MFS transporter [Anaerolineales bacterium]
MNNQKNIVILFFTLIVIMMGFGMVIPILPFYITSFGASGSAMGALMAAYAVMQFIFAPIWGDLSDQFGRKPILMIGVLGNVIAQLLFGLSTSMWMLFASRILAGLLSSATLPTAMAYISDSTSQKNRSGGMGILGAAMGIGMVIGPGIAGWLANISLSTPFFLASALSAIALVLVWAILPESLPAEKRVTSSKKIRGPQLDQMWKSLNSPIGFLFFIAFLLSFGLTNFESIFGLYALIRFEYGPSQVGILLTLIGLISAITQGMLTGPMTKRWGEVKVIKISLLASAIGFPLMLLATSYITILLTIGFFVLANSLLRPAVASLISKRATTGQGIAMGLNNSFMSLGRSIGPLVAGFFLDFNLNLPYITGGIIFLLGFILSFFKLNESSADDEESETNQAAVQT